MRLRMSDHHVERVVDLLLSAWVTLATVPVLPFRVRPLDRALDAGLAYLYALMVRLAP